MVIYIRSQYELKITIFHLATMKKIFRLFIIIILLFTSAANSQTVNWMAFTEKHAADLSEIGL